MELGTKERCDLFNACLCRRGPRCDARIEVVGFEGLSPTFAVAIDFGGDPHQRAGELPIVFAFGVDHPDHLTEC